MRYTTKSLIEAWAAGTVRGRVKVAGVIADGDTVYSYGEHHPLARKTGSREALVNGDRVGVTTSKHAGHVRGALAREGYTLTEVDTATMKEAR